MQRERARIGVDGAAHEGGKCLPRITVVRQRGFHFDDVAAQTVQTELL
jgi:hypothetical protein